MVRQAQTTWENINFTREWPLIAQARSHRIEERQYENLKNNVNKNSGNLIPKEITHQKQRLKEPTLRNITNPERLTQETTWEICETLT